jgi:aminopeptidase N
LLDGTADLPGLMVDADLRWALLARLVAVGAAEDAEIDEELRRDATANGQRQAASVYAARPTAAAKEEAWQKAVFDTSLPNALQTATIAGFNQPDQLDLLIGYRDRYFADAPGAFDRHTTEMARNVAEGLFPALLVSPETVAQAEEFLAGREPTVLTRTVAEGRDSLVRALAARECDA